MHDACRASTTRIAWTTRSVAIVEAALTSEQESVLRRRIDELEARLTSTNATLAKVTEERDKLRHAYEQLKGHLELIRRRIFVAQAERIDTQQLELEFAETQAKLVAIAKELADDGAEAPLAGSDDDPKVPRRQKSKGRRDFSEIFMPEERVEITDPVLEGTAERIGFEESLKLGRRRGGPIRIVMARVKYKVAGDGETEFVTAPLPKEIYGRGMLAPSFIAHILTKKFRFGTPFTRLAEELASEGIVCDDSTMCRYAEHVGATLGCIVEACAKEAKESAFCLSTDATGVSIQPAHSRRQTSGLREGTLLRRARRSRPRLLRVPTEAHERRGLRDVQRFQGIHPGGCPLCV
jgi:transposase